MYRSTLLSGTLVAVWLSGCANVPAQNFDKLQIGKVWLVEDINGSGVIDSSRVTIKFEADGRLSGQSTCNNYRASFSLDDGRLMVSSDIVVSQKICAPALMRQEDRFFETLRKDLDVSINREGMLLLRDGQGGWLLAI